MQTGDDRLILAKKRLIGYVTKRSKPSFTVLITCGSTRTSPQTVEPSVVQRFTLALGARASQAFARQNGLWSFRKFRQRWESAMLTIGNIQDGQVIIPSHGSLDSIPPGLRLEKDDLLFNRTNSPELVGEVRHLPWRRRKYHLCVISCPIACPRNPQSQLVELSS